MSCFAKFGDINATSNKSTAVLIAVTRKSSTAVLIAVTRKSSIAVLIAVTRKSAYLSSGRKSRKLCGT